MEEFALRDEFNEQLVSHLLGDGRQLPNDGRVLLLFVLLGVLEAQLLHLSLPLKSKVVELGSVSVHAIFDPALDVVDLSVELAIHLKKVEQTACSFQSREKMLLSRLLRQLLIVHLTTINKTTRHK